MRVRHRYFTVYKPYGMLSQFTAEEGKRGLGALRDFPKSVYPVGRLDEDSEGLLILTNDKSLNHLLLDPEQRKTKTYWCEVDGVPSDEALQQMRSGVLINLKGERYKTAPSKVNIIHPNDIPERDPPVNYAKHPTRAWLEIKITEGKNRQVRKMTAAVGHPTLRLIRYAIADLKLMSFEPGSVQELFPKKMYALLGIVER